MASDVEMELYRALTLGQQRYTYFLLAASASGIALAVRVTATATLNWSLIPLGAAVLAWGLSFVQGCLHVMYTHKNMHANADLLRIQRGEHSVVGARPQRIQAALEGINAAMDRNAKRAGRHADGQFLLLVVGGVLFVGWHVLGIVLRS